MTSGRRAAPPAAVVLLAGVALAAFMVLLVLAARPAAAAGGATVTGTVRSSTGTALAGVRVDVFGATYGNLVASTTSDPAGGFQLGGLPSYPVVVRYFDPAGTWAIQYFDRVATFASATRLTLPADATATADAALVPRAGVVTGTVGNGSGPLTGISVSVLNPTTNATVAATTTNAAGSYKVTGLAAGSYLVRYVDPGGTYGTEYFPSAPTAGTASPVTLTASTGAVADAELAVAGSVSGRLTAGRVAVPGVWAVLATPQPLTIAAAAPTDANGDYAIGHVTAGTYKLVFIDTTWTAGSSVGYRPRVYPDLDGGDPATQLAAIAAGTDQVVPAGGSLTGRDGHLRGADCTPAIDGQPTSASGNSWDGKKLMGCDLGHFSFGGRFLTGSDLTGAQLDGTNVSNADFSGTTLRGVRSNNLTGVPTGLPAPWKLLGGLLLGPEADVHDTTLGTKSLTGVDLTGAQLEGTTWRNLSGMPTGLPAPYRITGGYLLGPLVRHNVATFSGLDLSNLDLHGASLTICQFIGTDLHGADLTGADLNTGKFGGANFTGTDLAGSNLYAATSGSVIGSPASLPTGWVLRNGYLLGPGARLAAANLSGLDLSGLDLHDALFNGANLTSTNFTSATLTGANLYQATVNGAVFTAADLTGLSSNVNGTAAALPTGWHQVGGLFLGPGANLNGANLSGFDLTGWDLSGAVLTHVNFTGAVVTNTNFTDADVSGATFGALVFSGTNLTRATVESAGLNGANLSTATLTGIHGAFNGLAAGVPAGWSQAYKNDGTGALGTYLLGPGANLDGAALIGRNLTNKNLTGATLVGANLTWATLTGLKLGGADLTGATLAHTSSGNITGTPAALPAGWLLGGGYLLGDLANLAGANLHGLTLPGAHLAGATLTGADLGATELHGVVMTSADLTNANLTGADLTGGDLANATVAGATLTGTTLASVHSGGLAGSAAALPSPWAQVSGYLVGPGADLHSAALAGANLAGRSLAGADFSSANLSNANLVGADLTAADLRYTSIYAANLTGATLDAVRSGNTTTSGAILPAGWATGSGRLVGRYVDLTGVTLPNLAGAGVDLTGANLTGTSLTGATLTGANLSGTNLTGATLTGVVSGGITGTPVVLPAPWVLRGGCLLGPSANLTGRDLAGIDLGAVDLTGAVLTNVSSGGITGTPTALPASWTLRHGYLFGPSASLIGKDLSGLDLTGLDLHKAKVDNAVFDSADLTGSSLSAASGLDASFAGATLVDADLTDAYFTGAVFDGAVADAATLWKFHAQGASLIGMSLVGADLRAADLFASNVAGMNVTGADLTGIGSGALTGSPVGLPAPWVLRGGFLAGPGAWTAGGDLSGLDLHGVDLTGAQLDRTLLVGADLTGATLTGATVWDADFSGTTLTGVRSGGMFGPPLSVPTPWRFAYALGDGYLLGPGVDLAGANLGGLIATNLDLTGADLTGADLTGALLSNVNLTGANLTGATGVPTLSSVTYSNTTCPTGVNSDANGGTCVGQGW